MPNFNTRPGHNENNTYPDYDAIVYRKSTTLYAVENSKGENIISPTTNPTTALDAGVDEINRLSGGLLKIAPGLYTLDTEWDIDTSNIYVMAHAATIKASSSFATGSGTQLIHIGDGTTTFSNVQLYGLIVDANSKPNFGIRLHADNSSLTNVNVQDCTFKNAVLNGLSIETCTFSRVQGCFFEGGNTGLYGESNTRVSIVNNTFKETTHKGISLNASGFTIVGNTFTGVTSEGEPVNTDNAGINMTECSRSQIVGNFFKFFNVGITSGKPLAVSTPNRGNIISGNTFWSCIKGIELQRLHDSTVVTNNTMDDVYNGIELNTFGDTGFTYCICRDNALYGDNVAGGIGILINSGTAHRYDSNFIQNFATLESFTNTPTFYERGGTGTIDSGTTTETITHFQDYTPTAADIWITLTEDPTNTPGAIWVGNITATTFDVNCENDPGASNLNFSWHARRRSMLG